MKTWIRGADATALLLTASLQLWTPRVTAIYSKCNESNNASGAPFEGEDGGEDDMVDDGIRGYGRYDDEIYPAQELNGLVQKEGCVDATSNPRGTYTARYAACVFGFHKVAGADESAPSQPYRLSDACSTDNLVSTNAWSAQHPLEIKEYATHWPDECVGDLRRC
jgi:hypothetical protein